MRRTTPALLWLTVFLLAAAPAVQAHQPQDKPKKPGTAPLTMSIGGPVETMTVPVNSGDTKIVNIGDLIEIGLDKLNPYKGRLTWTVSPKPPKMGQNEKNRSVYFGTGQVNVKFHVTAWGVRNALDENDKPIPDVMEAYVVAECWIEVAGGINPGPGPGPGPGPVPANDLEKKLFAAWASDKTTGTLDTLAKVAATFDEVSKLLDDNNFVASPANILKEYTTRVKAKGVSGSTIPAVKNVIGDVMEAFLPASAWNDPNPIGFDNKGRMAAAFNNLSTALKKCK